jgi:UDP-glucose 4-epimerase
MRILITGGNGFIGKSIVESLNNKENQITILDSQINQDLPSNIKQIKGDFRDTELLKEHLFDVDLVIHLAALLGVDLCEDLARETLDANGREACDFFDLCKKMKVKKIIYTSSSEIYGNIENAKEDSQVSPKSDYAIAKLYSERYLRSIASPSFKAYVLRLFSIYGKNQRDDFVISRFMKLAKSNQKLNILGDQIRAFCHISDLVNAINLCIDYYPKIESFCLLNIGNDSEPISILELAKKILKLNKIIDWESRINFIPLEQTTRGENREIFMRFPSIQKAKKLFNYTPKTSLDKGLLEFL